MNLRFEVDQAESFRRGIDCPKSIVTVEVNPKDLSQEDRNLLADHMDGIDVVKLCLAARGPGKSGIRIVAMEPSLAALMLAVREQAKRELLLGVSDKPLDGFSPAVSAEFMKSAAYSKWQRGDLTEDQAFEEWARADAGAK